MIKKTFVYEDVSFDYTLIQEQRKTISATVYPNLSIIIKTPNINDNDKIDKFIKRKCSWILKQRGYFSQFKVRKEKEYLSGENFLYLGRSYKLLVHKSESKEYVSLLKGKLNVFSKSPRKSKNTKVLLDKWLQRRRGKVFNVQLNKCFSLFDYKKIPELKIRKLNKRWGSYLKDNTIILNPDLIMAAKKHINYIIIHELCHIKYKKHNKAFYDLLSIKVPDWEKVKLELELILLG